MYVQNELPVEREASKGYGIFEELKSNDAWFIIYEE